MMDEIGPIVAVIIIIGISGFFGFLVGTAESPANVKAAEVVTECESTLPRNQTCKYVITAEPESNEGGK